MPNRITHQITARGRLTDAEKGMLADLRDAGQGAGQIARRMGRHPSTVHHALVEMGEVASTGRRIGDYQRGGRIVRGFTADEDQVLLIARREGKGWTEISRAWPERFGHPRCINSLRIRVLMLEGGAP